MFRNRLADFICQYSYEMRYRRKLWERKSESLHRRERKNMWILWLASVTKEKHRMMRNLDLLMDSLSSHDFTNGVDEYVESIFDDQVERDLSEPEDPIEKYYDKQYLLSE
jgi:hypothetical protein